MKDLNKISLIGRLTGDAELGYMQSGSAKVDFTLAFTTSAKKGNEWVDESNFVNLTLWGKTGENLKQYLLKGTQVAIEGHLRQERWEKDGKKQSALKVVVDEIQLLSKGNGSQKKVAEEKATTENAEGFPEDIPF